MIPQLEENKTEVIDYRSVYNVTYDFNEQTVLLHDEISDVYKTLPWNLFSALLRAYYPDKERRDKLAHLILNFREVKILPAESRAIVKPPVKFDLNDLVGKALHNSRMQTITDPQEMFDFYLEAY